ncbi:MAG: SDR family oxidoreductase [Acidimicrobiales bacterium]
MDPSTTRPAHQLSHTTIAVEDLDTMLAFYCGVLGFHITNRGTVGPDGGEMAFISQDPREHHQIVFITGALADHQFVMVDHLAFRTNSLDDLRRIGSTLEANGVEGVIPISHGNAWSLYFNDPEGNGLECFVDSPFHVAQPCGWARSPDERRRDRGHDPVENRDQRRVHATGAVATRLCFTTTPIGRGIAMDLGIRGRHAIVCASSGGLGLACAEALAAEGVNITINGRTPSTLDETQRRLAADYDVEVRAVAGDIGDPVTRQGLFEACPEPDIVVNNNSGPHPGQFANWEHDDWIAALDANMLTPLAMIRLAVDGMVERGFGRIVNVTSAMVKSPRAAMGLSTGARAGLTSVSKALSLEVAAANVTINNLLPERFDTGRQRQMAELHASRAGITVDQAYAHMTSTIAAKRLGQPSEFGAACAFLCSAQAGFISGQNLQLDGGSYSGLL